MLKLTLEVNGNKISELKIVNDGTGNSEIGNYRYEFFDTIQCGYIPRKRRVHMKGVYGKRGAWNLVLRTISKFLKHSKEMINENLDNKTVPVL